MRALSPKNILKKCKELYGIVALVNTSFNNHEEPIVMTLNDALKSLELKIEELILIII